MQIWFVSLGFALALRKGMLAGTEVIIKLLPVSLAKGVILVFKPGMFAVAVLMLYAAKPLIGHFISTSQELPNLRIPTVAIYFGIYTDFTLAAIFILSSLLTNLRGHPNWVMSGP